MSGYVIHVATAEDAAVQHASYPTYLQGDLSRGYMIRFSTADELIAFLLHRSMFDDSDVEVRDVGGARPWLVIRRPARTKADPPPDDE